MFNKIRKIIKDISLPTLGAALALVLGALLLVPEAQSGVVKGTKNFTRASRETSGRKKMNRTNHSATYVPRYNVQRITYGPTDIPRFRRPEYVIMNGETNVVIVTPEGEKETRPVPVVEKIKISRGEDGEAVIYKARKQETGKPTGVHRVGRKGKEKERQREAFQAEQDAARSFDKESKERDKKLRKEGKGGGSVDASEASTNDLKTLMWQTAAPPSGSVHTASSPRRAGSLAKKGNVLRSQDLNGSARKIKERNRERQGECSVTNIARRAQYAGSADDKADADN
jgi:hypothetical protein